jgi:hypothetical protein
VITLQVPSGSTGAVMPVSSNDIQPEGATKGSISWGQSGTVNEECLLGRTGANRGIHGEGLGFAHGFRNQWSPQLGDCSIKHLGGVPGGWLRARYDYQYHNDGKWHHCRSAPYKSNDPNTSVVRNTTGNYHRAPCGDNHLYRTLGYYRAKRGDGVWVGPLLVPSHHVYIEGH